MLLDWTCDDAKPQKYTQLKLKISTIRGRFADGACQTIVRSYQLDLGSETQLPIQTKELLFDDAYCSKVVDDMKASFTWMKVLDLLFHQFFITANSLGWQPTTPQFFQPLTLLTLGIVAMSIHCAQSVYSTGKKVTVMFSQDEYRGEFCPSMMIDCLTTEAIALIPITHGGAALYPPPMVLLR